MLNVRMLRDDPEAVARALLRRGYRFETDTFRDLDARRRRCQQELDGLRHRRNEQDQAIGAARARGEDIAPLLARLGDDDARLSELESELDALDARLNAFLLGVPNLPDPDVPDGTDENDNRELRSWGEPRTEPGLRDHVALGELHDGMDFTRAATIAGSRFVVLRGAFARLQRALVQFMLDLHTREHGYTEVYVPHLANAASLLATGQLPKFEDDLFRLTLDPPLYLIPTAEVPLTNLVRGETLAADALPLRYVAHTPCYRAEAGSYGRDVRGMIRQHQFEKVELVQITAPDRSAHAHEELTAHAETVLRRLGLPYRVVVLCAGDMGFAAARTYDLEVWLPSQNRYREISSCSNFRDFQARRMGLSLRDGKKKSVPHTLNGSGLAVGRTLVALVENFQEPDGSIRLPEALWPYTAGERVLRAPDAGARP
jgi:seryl-tRNA synthetase